MKDLRFKNTELRVKEKGQTLITLLVFMVIAITVVTGAVAVTIINSEATSKVEIGENSYLLAQTGADNAVLRLLRNPNYTGETFSVGSGTVTITVSGTTTKTIVSEGVMGNFRRKIQVVGTFSGHVFTVSSWNEIN
ncbi:MAG: hypothetical protein WCV81_04250 [Microgenomates group bacterium]|jgi:hypothetical protein